MDTKWKSSHRKRRLTIVVLLAFTVGTMLFFPGINRRSTQKLAANEELQGEDDFADADVLANIYSGCYVLYREARLREGGADVENWTLFVEEPASDGAEPEEDETREAVQAEVNADMDRVLDGLTSEFETYRSYIDYAVLGEGGDSNTGRPLQDILQGTESTRSALISHYREIFVLRFNGNGVMEVEVCFSKNSDMTDSIIKELGRIDRHDPVNIAFQEIAGRYSETIRIRKPQNFEVIFALPRTGTTAGDLEYRSSSYWYCQSAYMDAGAAPLYAAALILLTAFALYMGSRRVWKDDVMINRPGRCCLMEAAALGICLALASSNVFVEIIWSGQYYEELAGILGAFWYNELPELVMTMLWQAGVLLFLYTVWYMSVCFIRPVFVLGLGEYIRQYSLAYQLWAWLRGRWEGFVNELHHIDFSERSTKVILKAVLVNFIVLAVISMLWFWGVFFLIVYSAALFYLLRKNYDKIGKDYQALLQGVNRIAEGDLNTVITEDLGIFEPFRSELSKIRTSFKQAVDDEVKSQRMRTELITNVSHDLKTPLTAITTYIALLKKEGITEEDRSAYIETLEKKSLRLKVLIEDLFEISKVSSNNIVLDLITLDVVSLLRQVSAEHTDKLEEQHMELRWNVPKEKVSVRLDNRKAYRIFENLFVNICKYGMHYSRVFIDVNATDAGAMEGASGRKAEIVLKNISAAELHINAEEISERFVRGDSSRNTEGSGLGLAIAKSLTEAQGGRFRVEIDGDLFKVIIVFPMEEDSDNR
ncbi:MAG: HAMP domain-containing histidine kinase [Roseburia sp.]|nr:HAMP domain-containing histidine kinase [Roseburia sp.]